VLLMVVALRKGNREVRMLRLIIKDNRFGESGLSKRLVSIMKKFREDSKGRINNI
jgi:hypothetical protein